jgi:hypothetical protein
VWVSGGRDRVDDEAEGTKTRYEKDKKVPLPTLWSQASSYPLFKQEGSAICDLLFKNYFLEREFCHFKTQQLTSEAYSLQKESFSTVWDTLCNKQDHSKVCELRPPSPPTRKSLLQSLVWLPKGPSLTAAQNKNNSKRTSTFSGQNSQREHVFTGS